MPSVCIAFFVSMFVTGHFFQRHVVRCPVLCLSPCPLLPLSSRACVHGVFLGVVCVNCHLDKITEPFWVDSLCAV